MNDTNPPIDWFRNTAPYINAHRGSTFVVLIPGEAQSPATLPRVLQDLALLASLGVRLVLVFGSRPQINSALAARGITSDFHNGVRISDASSMQVVREVVGAQRVELEALLSMGLPNSPMRGARLRVVSGNFITAHPLGVREGVDFQFSGQVRRVDAAAITTMLDAGAIVLLSSLGSSLTGESFNVGAGEVAGATARELGADKLVLLAPGSGIPDASGALVRQCTTDASPEHIGASDQERQLLELAIASCADGVDRCHIVSFNDPAALLAELFTIDGSGTLVTRRAYAQARWASIHDVTGVLELIQPLEESGVLRKRSRELLENEISRFRLLERDGRITACAALYPFPDQGGAELACIVTHPDYRNGRRARELLEQLENEARNQGLHTLFVLTTQTAHWFLEQGFEAGSTEDLPPQRQGLYNLQRNSKVFIKVLGESC